MKKRITLFFISLFSMTALLAQKQVNIIPDEILVQFQETVKIQSFLDDFNANKPKWNLDIKETLVPDLSMYLLKFDDSMIAAADMLDELLNQNQIKHAQLNRILEERETIPDDPFYDSQWDLKLMGASDVWDVSTGGKTVNGDEIVLAVLDKGFDYNHEDLQENLWVNEAEIPNDGEDNDGNNKVDDVLGWNFIGNSPIHPIEGHGTRVAGVLGAKGNNGIGVSSMNWDIKVMLLSVRTSSQITAGLNYVLEMREKYNATNGAEGAFIVATSTSLGFDETLCDEFPLWGEMYDMLGAAGILSAAAGPNEDWNIDLVGDMPTSCPSDYLIAVTNTNEEDEKVDDAPFGITTIDLGAPGYLTSTTDVFSTYTDGFSGTSSATPHVAAVIGSIYSLPCNELADMALANPSGAALLVKDAILEGAVPIPTLEGITVTGGRLNAYNSMKYLHSYCIANADERAAENFVTTYLNEKGFIRINPNPVQDLLVIDYSTPNFETISMKIYNQLGQLMYEREMATIPFQPQRVEINDIAHWAVGVYYISIGSVSEKITEKFLKAPN